MAERVREGFPLRTLRSWGLAIPGGHAFGLQEDTQGHREAGGRAVRPQLSWDMGVTWLSAGEAPLANIRLRPVGPTSAGALLSILTDSRAGMRGDH